MAEGIILELRDYCSYCGDFEPDVEKFDITRVGDNREKYQVNISCENAAKCAEMYEKIKERAEVEKPKEFFEIDGKTYELMRGN